MRSRHQREIKLRTDEQRKMDLEEVSVVDYYIFSSSPLPNWKTSPPPCLHSEPSSLDGNLKAKYCCHRQLATMGNSVTCKIWKIPSVIGILIENRPWLQLSATWEAVWGCERVLSTQLGKQIRFDQVPWQLLLLASYYVGFTSASMTYSINIKNSCCSIPVLYWR